MHPEVSSWRWIVLTTAFITVFVGIYIRIGFGILLPEMISDLSLSKTEAGFVSTAYFVGYTIFSPILGTLSDKIGGRYIIALFCGITGAGAALQSTTNSILTTVLFFGIVGIGSAAIWAPVVSVTQRWFSRAKRGMLMGVIDSGSSMAWVMTGSTLPIIVNLLGWRLSWIVLSLMAVLIAVFNVLLFRDMPLVSFRQSDHLRVRPEKRLMTQKSIFSSPFFWLVGIAYLTIGFAVMVPTTFTVTYANLELGLPYTISALLVTVAGVSRIPSTLGFAAVSDRRGKLAIIMLCHFFVFLGMFLLIFVGTNVFGLILSMVLFGLGNGGVWPLYAALTADHFVDQHLGLVVGVWTALLGIGFIFGPVTAGYIADRTGSFILSFTLSGLLSISGIVLLELAHRKEHK